MLSLSFMLWIKGSKIWMLWVFKSLVLCLWEGLKIFISSWGALWNMSNMAMVSTSSWKIWKFMWNEHSKKKNLSITLILCIIYCKQQANDLIFIVFLAKCHFYIIALVSLPYLPSVFLIPFLFHSSLFL